MVNPASIDPDLRAMEAALGPFFGNGRRPDFWPDFEVRRFVFEMHRQTTIPQCLALCAEKFGAERTPSKSALSRFWCVVDQARKRDRKRLK
jgi:hypothetical protein